MTISELERLVEEMERIVAAPEVGELELPDGRIINNFTAQCAKDLPGMRRELKLRKLKRRARRKCNA